MDVRMAHRRREQTRARYADEEGYAEREGIKLYYEIYGAGEPTVLLMPTWEIVHSRSWKFQIPYLARHCRVITFDPRGNGRSDRPAGYDALRHHFEQNFHVRHRLDQYGAGRLLDFDSATPEVIADMISQEIGRQVDYIPVERDGAPRAATLISELL